MVAEALRDHGIFLQSYDLGQRKTLCPLCSASRQFSHRKEPCLSVKIDDRGAQWSCHNCGWEGYVIEHLRNYTPGSLTKAVPIIQASEPLPGEAYKWLHARGLSMATLDAWGVGWDSATRSLAFPYREAANGPVVNIKYRDGQKRFRQVPGGKSTFYGLDKLDHSLAEVIIVEGEIDALSLAEVGIKNVLSVPDGAPVKISENPSDEEPKYRFLANARDALSGFSRCVLAVDMDQRGEYLRHELGRRLGLGRCWLVDWHGCKDANEALVTRGAQFVRDALANATRFPLQGVYTFDDHAADLEAFYDVGTTRGWSTGYADLDQLYTVRPGELTVISGAPHQGKSQFLDQLLYNLALSLQHKFLFVSLEKGQRMHFRTLAQIMQGKPFSWEDHGDVAMTKAEAIEARKWLSQVFKFFDARQVQPSVDNVIERAKALAEQWGMQGLVIDPYAYLRKNLESSETDFVGDMIGRLKTAGEVAGYHTWIVAHPHKLQVMDEQRIEPNPYQISGSAHWYNLGDNILTVARWGDGVSRIRVWKNRTDGTIGWCYLDFDKLTGRYRDCVNGGGLF